MSRKIARKLALALCPLLGATAAHAQRKTAPKAGARPAQTVRIAFLDPLSGPFAAIGQNLLRHFQYATAIVNDRSLAGPGVRFEIVAFDNKGSPQESLTLLRSVIDQDIRYVAQGNGSHVSIPLSEAIGRHNERNPGQAIVFLNYAAVDPDLTNSKCSFWHFRFDANTDIGGDRRIHEGPAGDPPRLPAEPELLARPAGGARGQEAAGAQASRHPDRWRGSAPARAGTRFLAVHREDPRQRGRYRDHRQLGRGPRTDGARGARRRPARGLLHLLRRRRRQVSYWHPNIEGHPGEDLYTGFRSRHGEEWYALASYTALTVLADAIRRSGGSADPLRVAHAMSGMRLASFMGEIEMRASDHQLQQPLFISTWSRAGGAVRHDAEMTGFGFRTERAIPAFVASQPTSCQMQRPPKP